jgi:hypothetical protein
MINELESTWELVFSYHPGIHLKQLRKITKNRSQGSMCPVLGLCIS